MLVFLLLVLLLLRCVCCLVGVVSFGCGLAFVCYCWCLFVVGFDSVVFDCLWFVLLDWLVGWDFSLFCGDYYTIVVFVVGGCVWLASLFCLGFGLGCVFDLVCWLMCFLVYYTFAFITIVVCYGFVGLLRGLVGCWGGFL